MLVLAVLPDCVGVTVFLRLLVQDHAKLQDFRPHFRAVLEHLHLLQQVLQLAPEPQITQSSSRTPQVGWKYAMWNMSHCAVLAGAAALAMVAVAAAAALLTTTAGTCIMSLPTLPRRTVHC